MYAGVVRMEMHNINGNHSPNMAARRSRPQHLVNGTGNKTASKGTGWIFFSRQIAMLFSGAYVE